MEVLFLTRHIAAIAVNNNLMYFIKNFSLPHFLLPNIFMKILQLWDFFIVFCCWNIFHPCSPPQHLPSFYFISLYLSNEVLLLTKSLTLSMPQVRGIFNLAFMKWKSFYFFRYIWVERDLCMEVPSSFYFQFSSFCSSPCCEQQRKIFSLNLPPPLPHSSLLLLGACEFFKMLWETFYSLARPSLQQSLKFNDLWKILSIFLPWVSFK